MFKRRNKSKYAIPGYLCASGRIRALETRLVTTERVAAMISAPTAADAYRQLGECGYTLTGIDTRLTGTPGIYELSKLINRERAALYALCESIAGTGRLTDFFRAAVDCHNIKTLIKADFGGANPSAMLLEGGLVSVKKLTENIFTEKKEGIPAAFAASAEVSREILSKTGDGQLADFVIDKAMLLQQAEAAKASEEACLVSYAKLLSDSANLRAAVRLVRQPGGEALMMSALTDTGSVKPDKVAAAAKNGTLSLVFAKTKFEDAAKLGDRAAADDTLALTSFEKACAEAVESMFENTRYVTAGAEIVIAYIAAREREYKTVRTLMSQKLTGAQPEQISARLGMDK